jgi:transposase-like protein
MARERKRWTLEQGRSAIESLARSGLSASTFARREGISRARLSYWKGRVEDRDGAAFVAVSLPPASRGQIEISHGEVVLRVREDLDVEHLARIVVALGARARGC